MEYRELNDVELIKLLEERGYEVRPRKDGFIKRTFEVDLLVWNHFQTKATERGLKLKHAVTEAFSDWVKK